MWFTLVLNRRGTSTENDFIPPVCEHAIITPIHSASTYIYLSVCFIETLPKSLRLVILLVPPDSHPTFWTTILRGWGVSLLKDHLTNQHPNELAL